MRMMARPPGSIAGEMLGQRKMGSEFAYGKSPEKSASKNLSLMSTHSTRKQ
jgi:hypothetical protein